MGPADNRPNASPMVENLAGCSNSDDNVLTHGKAGNELAVTGASRCRFEEAQ